MSESLSEAGLVHSGEAHAESVPLFSVSIFKLAVMSFFTAGFYEFYWQFKHWQALRLREKLDIMPLPRAIFWLIFCYSLFSRLQKTTGVRSYPGWCAAGYIITYVCYRLPDPYWLVSLFSFVFLIPAQAAANRVNKSQNPNVDRNARFTKANIACIALGLILLAGVIWGTFFPDPFEGIDLPEGIDVLVPTGMAAT